MKPTPSDLNVIYNHATEGWPARHTITLLPFTQLAEIIIKEWEDIRPADNSEAVAELNARLHERTQAFLAQVVRLEAELKAARAALPEWIPVSGMPLNRYVIGLYENGELANYKAMVPGGVSCTHYMEHETLANLPKRPEPPKPLTFGEPPAGWTWHNPENLTPGQVEVDQGWRLCLMKEMADIDHQLMIGGDWTGAIRSSAPFSNYSAAYRTKAPLPAPKPTAEEMERAAFEKVFDEICAGPGIALTMADPVHLIQRVAFRAWQAGLKGVAP